MADTALQVEFLLSGSTLANGQQNDTGRVYFFSPGTTTTKAVYSDKAKTAYTTTTDSGGPHDGEEYVLLNSGGRPGNGEVFADGTYDERVYDKDENLIETHESVTYEIPAAATRTGTTKTANFDIQTDTDIYFGNPTGGDITGTFDFTAASVSSGTKVTIFNINATNTVNIAPSGADTFNGDATWALDIQYEFATFESDGTNWYVTTGVAPVKIPQIADFTNSNHRHDKASTGLPSRASIGHVRRPRFSWTDADTVVIGPGSYHHNGTTEQIVYILANQSFDFAGLGNNEWNYLYIDDSEVVSSGTNVLTVEFVNTTTAPTFSITKHGWYNGLDRCIFAVRTSGAGAILEFYHDGDLVVLADELATTIAVTDISEAAWTDVELGAGDTNLIPTFTLKGEVTFRATYSNANTLLAWRTPDQTATTGHQICRVAAGATLAQNTVSVITDSNGEIEIKESAASTNTYTVVVDGWYFGVGT